MEKVCKECGDRFQSNQPKRLFCGKTHTRLCKNPNCGKEFTPSRRRLNSPTPTCSNLCAGYYRSLNAHKRRLESRNCQECGDKFTPHFYNEKYCRKVHHRFCEVCQNPYFVHVKRLSKITKACGPSCGASMSHTEEAKANRREESLRRHGVEHPFQSEAVKGKIAQNPRAKETRYGSRGFERSMEEKYGVRNAFLLPDSVPGRISKPNIRWKELLESRTGLPWKLEQSVAAIRSVDLYCEHMGVKLAVEINPTATHNSHKHLIACNRRGCTEFPCSTHGKGISYHRDRVIALRGQGIELVSIFDWMDEDKLLNFIAAKLKLQSNKIGARSCELVKISQREANKFLKFYHLMGGSQKQEHCYGLFFEGNLLQVQTFAKSGEGWEARRLATHPDWVVVGGVSRGTKSFISDVKPEFIVAYSDLNLGYADFDSSHNGFLFEGLTKPQLCWSKGSRMILNKSAAFQSADRLLGIANNSKDSPYPASWKNEDVFLAEGWLPVWDCGKIKEVWGKDNP